MNRFIELGLSKLLVSVLDKAGYVQPTEIQAKTIGLVLNGKDLLASAETGSGKTAAFALPIIERLEKPGTKPRALVLAPTRELALQVASQFKLFGGPFGMRTVTLYGGVGMEQQIRALRQPVDIIVATPGRLLDLVDNRHVDLSTVQFLVLDEADRLLDFGFMPQLRRINSRLPKQRQTVMFSATIDQRVARIAGDFCTNPVTVNANSDRVDAQSIEQKFLHVHEFGKDALLLKLITDFNSGSVLVFTRTKRKATWVKERLREANVGAEEIHSDISQSQRERTLKKYRQGDFSILVATDVAARGLDIPTISHVINYDLPDTPEDYVHRIGRTGRAGRAGVALSFISEEQRHLVRDIERVVGRQLDSSAVPLRRPASGRRFSRGRR